MSGENENPQTRGSGGRPRRSSLAEMFGSRPSVDTAAVNGNNLPKPSTSMASAIAQQAQQQSQTRRLSITSLGLSGSPTRPQGTAFDTLRERGQASGGRGRRQMEADESAVDEDGDSIGPINGESGSRPTSPSMGRRLSFGAKAYNEARKGSVGNNSSESSPTNGNIAGSKGSSPPNARKGAEGFNWSDSLRTRAKRSSVSAGSGQPQPFSPTATSHARAKSVAASEPAAPGPAPQKPPSKAPDHFQERILKGDFYMD